MNLHLPTYNTPLISQPRSRYDTEGDHSPRGGDESENSHGNHGSSSGNAGSPNATGATPAVVAEAEGKWKGFFKRRLHSRATTNNPTSFLDVGFYLWETDGRENCYELVKRLSLTFVFLSAAGITALRPMFVDHPRAGVTEIFFFSAMISLVGAFKSLCARQFSDNPKNYARSRDFWDLLVPVLLVIELLLLRFKMHGFLCSFCTPETLSK